MSTETDASPIDQIKSDLGKLPNLLRTKRGLEKLFADVRVEIGVQEKLDAIDKQMEALEEEKKKIMESAESLHEEETEEYLKVVATVNKLISEAKRSIHALPIDFLRKSQEIKSTGVQLKVGSVKTYVEFDRAILEAIPDLADMEIDGLHAVEKVINPDVLERLILQGKVSSEVAIKFRSEQRSKAPSVSISVDESFLDEEG